MGHNSLFNSAAESWALDNYNVERGEIESSIIVCCGALSSASCDFPLWGSVPLFICSNFLKTQTFHCLASSTEIC